MRILQVFNSRIQKHGSFEDFMIELADKAKSNNIQVGFVFPRINTQEVKEKLESFGAKVYTIEDSWKSSAFLKKLMNIVRLYRPDTLDFHFCYSANFAFIFLILKLMGIKIIYHYHGEIIPVENLKFINRHFSKLRLLTLFADKTVCVSEANKKFLEALNIRKKIDVVYNGVSVKSFQNMHSDRQFKKEARFTNGELVVSSIASLIPRKGIDVLIRAAKEVIDRIPQARFVLVGDGNKDRYQKLIGNLGVSDKVLLTGLIREYPYYILKDTDVFVSASFAESFGLSIAEAQLLGIPVVATNVGGVPEVVSDGNSGFLVPVGDSKGLALAIIKLLEDEELRKKFGSFGKKWVSDRFDLENKVEELVNVFVD